MAFTVEEMIRTRVGTRRLPISGELIVDMFTEGNEIHARVLDGLPDDAQFMWATYDHQSGRVYLVVGSEGWDGEWNMHDDLSPVIEDIR